MAESGHIDEMPHLEPFIDLGLQLGVETTISTTPSSDIFNICETSDWKPSRCNDDYDRNNNQVSVDEEKCTLQQHNQTAVLCEPEVLPGSESDDIISDCQRRAGRGSASAKDDLLSGMQKKDENLTSLPNYGSLHRDDNPRLSHSERQVDKLAKVPQPSTAEHLLEEHYSQSVAACRDEWSPLDLNEHVGRLEKFLSKEPTSYLKEPPLQEKYLISRSYQSDQKTGSFKCVVKFWPPSIFKRLTATELAEVALASDNGGWLVFDPNAKQPSRVQSEAEKFLANYLPSKVTEVKGKPINWISARAPMGYDEEDEDEEEEEEDEDEDEEEEDEDEDEDEDEGGADVHGLLDAWKNLQESGQHVMFQTIKELAVAHRCLSGKWLIYNKTGPHVDVTWERIFRATITGRLGMSTKVSTAFDVSSVTDRHVICVYSRDFTDKADVMELERRLRGLGIRCRMTYKPDAFTYLGVYRGNVWGLKPTIYSSEFEVCRNSSTILSCYEEE